MTGRYFIAVTQFLSKEVNEQQIYLSELKIQLYKEFKYLVIRTSLRSSALEYENKMINVQIPKSQCMLFFSTFNGIDSDTYGLSAIAINELCRQIEEQLYKKGNFKFESL